VVEAPAGSITAGLDGLPAGTYRVMPHVGTWVAAKLSGGGEAFEARFARDLEGSWRGDPADLRQPMSAEVSIATAAVDAGIELRSRHAREDYLDGVRFPRIRFRLDRLVGAGRAADGKVAYRADGTVELMGRSHRVAVTGALVPTDAAARRRLGFAPADAVFRATAFFQLTISETALAPDAGDFDGDVIPIEVSLLLRREAGPTR
jgi:polyisoprenoid-binding protein YceI